MNFLYKYFKFNYYNTTFKKEIIAGITTFLAIFYIIMVNSKILSQTGMSEKALITSTIIIASFSSIGMGLYAKNPYVIAPAMGMNIFFTYTVVKKWDLSWDIALGAVFWSGVIFIILTIFNIRSLFLKEIPQVIKNSLGAGIGIFISLIGLSNGEFIQHSTSGLLEIAPITHKSLIFIICFFLLIILLSFRIKASILLMIVTGCLISYIFKKIFKDDTIIIIPDHVFSLPDFSLFFSINWLSSFTISIIPAVLTFLFINIFDSSGTLIGITHTCKWLNKDNKKKIIKKCLIVDAFSATSSGIFGSSPTSIYIESIAGISVGGRTGLVAIITGLLFLPFLFLSSIISMVPIFVIAPVLIIIGSFMLNSIKNINWEKISESIPAFITIILIPLTLSISEGISWGMITWFIMKLIEDHKKITVTSLFITICCFIFILYSLKIIN